MSSPSAVHPDHQARRAEPRKVIGVRALLISGDIQTIENLCHLMEKKAIQVEVCSDSKAAGRKLCRSKFEAIIVDFKNEPAALELVKKPRQMTSHKGAVVIALLNNADEMPSAFRAGASFSLARPFLQTTLLRTFNAAYPLMVRERRRYYRYPLQVSVQISGDSRSEFSATTVNISEGGLALATSISMRVGERVQVKLKLPGTERTVSLGSEVCWNDDLGRVGLEFVHVPNATLESLQIWLSNRLEECLPSQ